MAEKTNGTIQEVAINSTGHFVGTGTSPRIDMTTVGNNTVEKQMNPTDDRALVGLITQRFDSAVSFTQNLRTKWDDFYKYYRGYVAEKDKKWVSNLFVPVAFTVIETLLPRILSVLFAPKFIVNILPREANDIKMVRVLKQLLKYQFDRFGAFNKFYLWVKDCLMYGTGLVKVYWKVETRIRTVTEPIYMPIWKFKILVGRRTVKKMMVEYDDPEVEVIDPYDFFVDPRATNLDDARWCIHRVWRDYDYMLKKEKEGFYKNVVSLVSPGVSDTTEIDNQVRNEVNANNTSTSIDNNFKVELWEYWEDGRVVVIANKTVIVRDDENPFWHGKKPFCLLKDIELPHEFYAMGEIEPIQSLINERNEIRNQRLDNVKSIVNRKLVVDRNADIDLEHIDEDNRPGGIILCDDVSKVKYLDEIDIVASAYNEDQMIVRDIQEATAMAETTIGVVPRRGETATAVNALQNAASARFSLKIQGMVSTGILALVRMLIQLNMQFLSKKRLVRIVGEDGEDFPEISADDISGNYDYEIQSGLLEFNKDIERQQWLMLLGTPVMNAPNINFEEVQKYTFELFNIATPERFITEMTPEMRMAMAMGAAGPDGTPGKPATPSGKGVPSIKDVPGTPAPQM